MDSSTKQMNLDFPENSINLDIMQNLRVPNQNSPLLFLYSFGILLASCIRILLPFLKTNYCYLHSFIILKLEHMFLNWWKEITNETYRICWYGTSTFLLRLRSGSLLNKVVWFSIQEKHETDIQFSFNIFPVN